MLRTTRLLAVSALVVVGLVLAVTPSQAATAPGEVGLVAISPVTVAATSTGWSHTISGMAAHVCGRSTPALWNAIARANGISNPDRISLGQRIVIRCVVNQPAVAQQARPKQPQATTPAWVAPLAGTLLVRGDCKVGGSGGHWLAQRSGHLHKGIDFSRPYGTPVRSVRAGKVALSRYQAYGAGWYIMIDHGEYESVAMHLRARSPLPVGTTVRTGQVIGYVGSTGASSGPHLHFEIHHGRSSWSTQVNPSRFLRAHGIAVKGC